MKCLFISYFLALLFIWNINAVQKSKINSEIRHSDEIKKLVDCKICQEMFEYEFNYEKLLKDDFKINFIKTFFSEIRVEDFNLNDYFSKDNLDFVSKEISMQYFFKGEDTQFSSEESLEKFKNCKNIKSGDGKIPCDILKLRLCENVLSVESDVCVNLNEKLLLFKNRKDNQIIEKEEKNNNIKDMNEANHKHKNNVNKDDIKSLNLQDQNLNYGERKMKLNNNYIKVEPINDLDMSFLEKQNETENETNDNNDSDNYKKYNNNLNIEKRKNNNLKNFGVDIEKISESLKMFKDRGSMEEITKKFYDKNKR